jgi:SAM-dependent methyltransferase
VQQRPDVAGVFDRAAATYDQVGVELFGPTAELLLSELQVRAGERVLDVGCGRGAVLLRAARLAGRADGVDLSPGMVAAARQLAAEASLDVDVRVDDAMRPAGPPGAYDVVASSLVLFFLPDPAAALQAWRQLLAPGGRLGVTTFGDMDADFRAVDALVMARLPGGTADARTTGRRGPFASDEGVAQLVGAAGFDDVRTVSQVVPVRFDDEEHWYRWSWSTGQRAAWENVPAGDRPALRAEAGQLLRGCRRSDGRLGFDQVVRCTLAVRS